MRIGSNTRRRVNDIKHDMEDPLKVLETCLARLNEFPGTKRMSVQLENAVAKLRRWQRASHFH